MASYEMLLLLLVALFVVSNSQDTKPDFGTVDNQPHDMNVTEGDTVTILCQATPAGKIQWYKNDVEFTQNSLPPKFSLNSNLTMLTITNVCKHCFGTDLMTIQCNVSNSHGYAFGQGYVNVLAMTEITSASQDLTWTPYKTYELVCDATCDDSTPCSWTWTLGQNQIQENGQMVYVDDLGTLHINTSDDSDAGASWVGSYKCAVTNGYSEATITSTITRPPDSNSKLSWIIGLCIGVSLLHLAVYLPIRLYLRRRYNLKFCWWLRSNKEEETRKDVNGEGNTHGSNSFHDACQGSPMAVISTGTIATYPSPTGAICQHNINVAYGPNFKPLFPLAGANRFKTLVLPTNGSPFKTVI